MTALPEEIEGAIAEGAELYGLKAPHHIEADAEGNVAALWAEPQIIGPIDAWGRARPIHADVELERIPATLSLLLSVRALSCVRSRKPASKSNAVLFPHSQAVSLPTMKASSQAATA